MSIRNLMGNQFDDDGGYFLTIQIMLNPIVLPLMETNSISLREKIFLPSGECVWSFSSACVCCEMCWLVVIVWVNHEYEKNPAWRNGAQKFIDLSKCPTKQGKEKATTSFTNQPASAFRDEADQMNWKSLIGFAAGIFIWILSDDS